jgi:hypothetical protein
MSKPTATTVTLDPKEEAEYLDHLKAFQDRLTRKSPSPARLAVAAHYQQGTLKRLQELKTMRTRPSRRKLQPA